MSIAFTELELSVNQEVKTISFNGHDIEVIQYLPLQQKSQVISDVVNYSIDDKGYFNPMEVQRYQVLETIYAYTNITFTDEDKEDDLVLYDKLVSSGLYTAVVAAIPVEEFEDLCDSMWSVIENIYKYNNSFAGAMNAMSQDYSNLNLDIEELQGKIGDPQNLTLLKDVLTKLG